MTFRCIKIPRPCDPEAYESATKKIADHAEELTNVIAVYRIGNVASPGISDLDIVIVVKDGTHLSQEGILANLSADERYTLMHGLFCVNETFWRNRYLFFKFDNLSHLRGRYDEPEDLPPKWLEWSALRIALQHLIRVYSGLSAQLCLRFLKVRSLLCELNALRYDFETISPLVNRRLASDFSDYLENVKQVRAHWFHMEMNHTRIFIDLCVRGKILLANAIEQLDRLSEIRFVVSSPISLSSGRVAIISSNMQIHATTGIVTESVSWTAASLKYFSVGQHFAGIVAKLGHRIGKFKFGMPPNVFLFVINSTWQMDDTEHGLFIAKRSEIISSNLGKTPNNAEAGKALPMLDFHEI